MSLYREVKRQAGVPVTIALWKHGESDDVRQLRESAGQVEGEYADLDLVPVGEDLEKGRALLEKHKGNGAVHVFCVYQISLVWRQLIREAKESGSRVVVYAEAPCEMCLGVKAWLKRLYYRFVLPFKIGWVAKYVDLFLCQSGDMGMDRLVRLGWQKDKIVPFGYASDFNFESEVVVDRCSGRMEGAIHILHTGIETPYRDVATLLKAAKILKRNGVSVEVVRTHGGVPLYELERLYRWADVFVACGLCEPWGMRVNDAIHAGLPVVVSSGMGAKMIVEQHGCGSVYKAGDAKALAVALQRFAEDRAVAKRCRDGVVKAHEAWSPENKANEFIKLISL
jgi:glycosyltransferase involved in cell wall biosynthesis